MSQQTPSSKCQPPTSAAPTCGRTGGIEPVIQPTPLGHEDVGTMRLLPSPPLGGEEALEKGAIVL